MSNTDLSYVLPVRFSKTKGWSKNTDHLTEHFVLRNQFYSNVTLVTAFGATGDGLTDDTAAIQAAIDSMELNPTHNYCGELIFPAGTYKISSTLRVKKDGVRIEGQGSYATVLAATAGLGANPVIYFEKDTTATAQISNNAVENLAITLTHDSSIGIQLDRAIQPLISRVRIVGNNSASSAEIAVLMDGYGDQTGTWGGGLQLHHCYISNVKYGLRMVHGITACHIVDNWIMGNSPILANSIGVYIDENGGAGSGFLDNVIENEAYGIRDEGILNKYIGNRFENCNVYAIDNNSKGTNYTVVGNSYASSALSLNLNPGRGILIDMEFPFTITASTNSQVVVVDGAPASGPMFALSHTYESAGNLAIWKAYGRASTNVFGETLAAREVDFASTGDTKIKIGTSYTSDTEFYRNNAKVAAVTTNGFAINGSAWNGNHLVMGSYHLWIDGAGSLRVKSGAPASDTDGTVVGAQTAP